VTAKAADEKGLKYGDVENWYPSLRLAMQMSMIRTYSSKVGAAAGKDPTLGRWIWIEARELRASHAGNAPTMPWTYAAQAGRSRGRGRAAGHPARYRSCRAG
jgi:hypothetical protein